MLQLQWRCDTRQRNESIICSIACLYTMRCRLDTGSERDTPPRLQSHVGNSKSAFVQRISRVSLFEWQLFFILDIFLGFACNRIWCLCWAVAILICMWPTILNKTGWGGMYCEEKQDWVPTTMWGHANVFYSKHKKC